MNVVASPQIPTIPASPQLLAALHAILGDKGLLTAPDDMRPFLTDWRGQLTGTAAAVARPASTKEVAGLVRLCAAAGVAIVPQGGNTGLMGGATPYAHHAGIVVSMGRMNRVIAVDPMGYTMTVESGCVLQTLQELASSHDRLLPLSLGAQGSCTIGGNLSTNAGGAQVLHYGNTRSFVLGVEVVLPSGEIWDGLKALKKDNTGYDLKHLFIGAEGTLGVVTRLVLRLFPKPASECTALVACPSYAGVLDLLRRARAELGGALSAFEVMWPEFYTLATTEHAVRPPLPSGHAVYVLMDSLGSDQARDTEAFSAMIERALDDGIVADAVIAQSHREGKEIWGLRDSVVQFQRTMNPQAGFDISIPIGRMQDFVDTCKSALRAADPTVRAVWFGHIADSNLHICVKLEPGGPTKYDIDHIVYTQVRDYGGSVSAEHGIGLLKRPYLGYTRTPEEIAVMRRIKAALDPDGILNPGKVFSD